MNEELIATLEEHQLNCLEWLRYRDYRPRTIDTYRLVLKEFNRWVSDQSDLRELSALTASVLQNYMIFLSLRTSKKTRRGSTGSLITSSTKLVHLASLRMFFGYLVKEGALLTNPTHDLERPKTRRRLPRNILTQDEVLKILAHVQGQDPVSLRDRAIFELLYTSGLRRNELEQLTLGSVLLTESLVRVRGKGDKERLVPMGEEAKKAIQAYLQHGRPKMKADGSSSLFLSRLRGPLRASAILRTLKIIAKEVGITRQVDLHCIRHTCATHMLQGGADIRYIQEFLGHTLMATTQIYTRVDTADLKKMLTECHPREQF